MKKLYTACYGRVKTLPRSFLQVQTSKSTPRWWRPENMRVAREFIPSSKVFAWGNDPRWKQAYRLQIDALHLSGRLEVIVEHLPENAVLLCFEGNPDMCHRGVLSDYLNEKEIADVSEWISKGGQANTERTVLI